MSRHPYRRIAIATAAIAASLAIMVPAASASTVDTVTASPSSFVAGAVATYTVNFNTSATGALGIGVGTITLSGHAGTQFPLTASDYTVNGNPVTLLPTHSASNNVTIVTPIVVNSSSFVAVTAGTSNTARNTTTAGSDTISVSSSSDTTPTFSNPPYTIVAGDPIQLVVASGSGQSNTVGTAFTTLLSVSVDDQFGNPVLVAGSQVTFTAPASGASGTFANGLLATTERDRRRRRSSSNHVYRKFDRRYLSGGCIIVCPVAREFHRNQHSWPSIQGRCHRWNGPKRFCQHSLRDLADGHD